MEKMWVVTLVSVIVGANVVVDNHIKWPFLFDTKEQIVATSRDSCLKTLPVLLWLELRHISLLGSLYTALPIPKVYLGMGARGWRRRRKIAVKE